MDASGVESAARAGPAIEARSLMRRYPGRSVPAVAGVDLVVERGQWVALLGPNGSGKSTLLRILATLDVPSEGEARILGWSAGDRAGVSSVRARLGVVFQSVSLDPLLSVRENLMVSAATYAMPASEARDRIACLALELDIGARLDDRVGTLSGGLARRADLARALMHGPELLLLDEASAGLDLGARLALLDLLERARAMRRGGLTILSATHMMDEGERSDRVVMMHGGRIVADGTPTALRAARGERLLRVEDTAVARDVLARAGVLESAWTSDGEGREVVVSPGTDRERAIVEELLGIGAAFRIGAATLGDVYLALTGASLDDTREAA